MISGAPATRVDTSEYASEHRMRAIERAALLAEGAMITAADLRLGDFSPSGASKDAQNVVKIGK